jgi:hypothetical protein
MEQIEEQIVELNPYKANKNYLLIPTAQKK